MTYVDCMQFFSIISSKGTCSVLKYSHEILLCPASCKCKFKVIYSASQ